MSSPIFHVSEGSIAFPTTLPPYFAAILFETFLYGLYVILFAICSYVLLTRNKRLHWILFVSATVMFALATSDIIYTYYVLFGKVLKNELTFKNVRTKYWLYVTNNVLADSLLLYRCWVVWEFRKLVIAGPVILLLAGTCFGYFFEGSVSNLFDKAWIYLVMTLVLNLILTALTAGRIWWLARKAKLILGTGLLRRYSATITILIESGVIYSLYIILVLGFRQHPVAHIVLDGGLIQVVGIMPTLIIVQVGLGRAVHDIEANDAIARLEGNKADSGHAIHCVRSRECHHASSETFVGVAHHERHLGGGGGSGSSDTAVEMEHEIGIDSLRQLRGESLQLSWEFGISASPPQELGVLQQAAVSKTV